VGWVRKVTRIVRRILVGKTEGKRPLRRPRHMWEDNTKLDIREVGFVLTGFIWFRIETSGRIL
jgi:hypothetical protein